MRHRHAVGKPLKGRTVLIGLAVTAGLAVGGFGLLLHSKGQPHPTRAALATERVCARVWAKTEDIVACEIRVSSLHDDPETHPFEKPLGKWH